MKQHLFILWVCLVGSFLSPSLHALEHAQQKIAINSHLFTVEIADTPDKRALGLMFREHLAPTEGMLFFLDKESLAPFWMKNTPLSLDILWINSKKVIVSIKKKATPFSEEPLNPHQKALYVLEISGGLSDAFGLKPGQHVRFIP